MILINVMKVVPRTSTWIIGEQKSSFYLITNIIKYKLEAAGGPIAP